MRTPAIGDSVLCSAGEGTITSVDGDQIWFAIRDTEINVLAEALRWKPEVSAWLKIETPGL